jgi:hypothetical protein
VLSDDKKYGSHLSLKAHIRLFISLARHTLERFKVRFLQDEERLCRRGHRQKILILFLSVSLGSLVSCTKCLLIHCYELGTIYVLAQHPDYSVLYQFKRDYPRSLYDCAKRYNVGNFGVT